MSIITSATRYKNHRFPIEIISHAVWLYFRCWLSFRDVEALLMERGVIMTYAGLYPVKQSNRVCQLSIQREDGGFVRGRNFSGTVNISFACM